MVGCQHMPRHDKQAMQKNRACAWCVPCRSLPVHWALCPLVAPLVELVPCTCPQAIVLLSSCLQPGRHTDLQLHALEGCITVITYACLRCTHSPLVSRVPRPQVAGDARAPGAVLAGQPDHGGAARVHAGGCGRAGGHQGGHCGRGAAGQTRVRGPLCLCVYLPLYVPRCHPAMQ